MSNASPRLLCCWMEGVFGLWKDEVKMIVKMERNKNLDKTAGIEGSKYPRAVRPRIELFVDCPCIQPRQAWRTGRPTGKGTAVRATGPPLRYRLLSMVRAPPLAQPFATLPTWNTIRTETKEKEPTTRISLSGLAIVLLDRHGIIGYQGLMGCVHCPQSHELQS